MEGRKVKIKKAKVKTKILVRSFSTTKNFLSAFFAL